MNEDFPNESFFNIAQIAGIMAFITYVFLLSNP